MVWIATITSRRIVELRAWLAKVEKIDSALAETTKVIRQMSLWSQGQVPENRGELQKLTHMSFKKGVELLTEQLAQIEQESKRLYREEELRQYRGTFQHGQYFYNNDFDTKAAWVLEICFEVQQVLISLQIYIKLLRTLFPDIYSPEGWKLYDAAMDGVSALVFIEEDAGETVSNALTGLDLGKESKKSRLETLLRELRRS